MKNIILFGTGKTAQVMRYHIEREGGSVAAFTIDREFFTTDKLSGIPVVLFDEVETHYPPEKYSMFITVGYKNLNVLRAERVEQAEKKGYTLINYVSPSAIIWDDLKLSANCKISERTLMQPYSEIGKNVFVGSGCVIGHHSTIMDHCFIASGVTLGGGVTIEPYCFLGTGSVIRNDITIKRSTVIGAGVTLLESTEPESVYLNRSSEKMSISSTTLTL
jgi:sugar O-acyltransferase (sialic acid O-acetyltransferase NeuD family)